jgi:hypothetical protein
MRTCAVFLLATLTAAAQSPIQNWETVKSVTTGTEVRIAIGSRTVRGDMIRATDDALVVASGKGQEMFTNQQVTRVSIRKTGHRGRNALIGLGVGAGVGAGIGAADDANCRANHGFLCGLALPILGILGGVIGTVVGVVWPSGGWREVYRK